jgi:DNA replicative helicase MCM subunit Mcm2 (Cdc46/Mcm family)
MAITVIAMQLEALMRLGEASASVRLSREITLEDALRMSKGRVF